MPTFEYVGKNKYGEIVKGTKAAPDLDEARRLISRDQIVIQKITKKGSMISLDVLRRKIVSVRDLALFTRQLATIINAGVPLTQGLGILVAQIKNKKFKQAVDTVKNDVEGGMALEEALRKHPKAFTDLYVNMTAAGEKSGNLPEVLSRLANFLERQAEVTGKVKSAMTYPLVVLAVAIGITFFILYKVVPTFAKIYAELGAELPILSQYLINASNFLVDNVVLIILIIIGIIIAIRYYYKTDNGKRVIDRLLLKVPALGDVILKGAVARFSRSLATMITSGVDLLVALEITAKTAGNSIIEDAVMEVRNMVTQGKNLSDSILTFQVFPPMLGQMIAVGENTGALDEMLSKIADFYEDEVDRAVDTMLSIIEPAMIIFLGVLVGTIVVALYLPMFKLIQTVG